MVIVKVNVERAHLFDDIGFGEMATKTLVNFFFFFRLLWNEKMLCKCLTMRSVNVCLRQHTSFPFIGACICLCCVKIYFIYEKKLIKTCGAVKVFRAFLSSILLLLTFPILAVLCLKPLPSMQVLLLFSRIFFLLLCVTCVCVRASLLLLNLSTSSILFFVFIPLSDKFIFISAFHFGYYICLFNLM